MLPLTTLLEGQQKITKLNRTVNEAIETFIKHTSKVNERNRRSCRGRRERFVSGQSRLRASSLTTG
jgi:hypothetical protein